MVIKKTNISRKYNLILVFFILAINPAGAHHGGEGITGIGVAGPIITVPAYTLPKGLGFIDLRSEYTNFDTFSSSELIQLDKRHEHIHDTAHLFVPSLALGYGLTNNLTFGLRLPYVFRYGIQNVHDGVLGKEGNSIGIGDITFYSQYRFLRNDKYKLHAALLSGIKIPSGVRRDEAKDGFLFEQDEQPGSGSWDPLVGIAVSKQLGKFSLDTNGLYKFATMGSQDSNLGDVVNYNVSLSYRINGDGLYPYNSNDGRSSIIKKMALDLIFEANGIWSQKPVTEHGFVDENHGGTLIYLSPGLRLTFDKSWIWSTSVGLPAIEDLNGRQRAPSVKLVSGITKVF